MKFTHFKLFYNTPMGNYNKYQHFNSNTDRDNFYDSGIYQSIDLTSTNFNMVRDRLEVNLPLDYDKKQGLNYCYFNDDRSGKRYYCFIDGIRYINDKVARFTLVIDVLTTYFQGRFDEKIGYVNITRQHVTLDRYNNNIRYLADRDYLSATSPRIINQSYVNFASTKTEELDNGNVMEVLNPDTMYVIFQSSSNLAGDFGNTDKPKLPVSNGGVYDGVYSPVNLYVCHMQDAKDIFKQLSDFPWIAQTLKSILIISDKFIDDNDLQDVSTNSLKTANLYRFKNNAKSKLDELELENITYSKEKFAKVLKEYYDYDLLNEEAHLFNSNYFNIFCTNWATSSLQLKPQNLPDFELSWQGKAIIGYDNKIIFYPQKYNSVTENLTYDNQTTASGKNIQINIPRGEFTQNAITFNSFDELPIYINNYKMSIANNAYARQAHDDYRLDNQVKSLVDKDTSNSQRLYNAMSVVSNASPSAMASNFRSEYEYYRDLKVQQEQAKIANPTITSQTTGNAWALKNGYYGISVKLYGTSKPDILQAVKFHKTTGYEWERYEKLENVNSMSLLNYVQFKGDWVIEDVPIEHLNIAKALFAEGVSLYHNTERIKNPFNVNIINNRRIK